MATKRSATAAAAAAADGGDTGLGNNRKAARAEVGETDVRAVNAIRVLAAETVQKAKSGHPGAPMGCAPLAHALFHKVMNFNPADAGWAGRDRFVLSNGHACALQYVMLHLSGYSSVSMEDLQQFRQIDSVTPGHPENFATAGVEVSTGPLGQGISNAVGLAIAESHLAAVFNRDDITLFDNYTYVICGDGCLQEGVSSEACSLAGHLGLGKLIVLYDDNNITIDGETNLSFTEDVRARYDAYGWHTSLVDDANNLDELLGAISAAQAETQRPSLIAVKTIIGHGSQKQGTEKVHGAPLGDEDLRHVKETFGFDPDVSFSVPEDVRAFYASKGPEGEAKHNAWLEKLTAYETAYPQEAAALARLANRELPLEELRQALPTYTPTDKAMATRKFSQIALNAMAPLLPELVGGSADLTPSNLTFLDCSHNYSKEARDGRYMRFGVREHGMTAIANGMFAYGFLRPFVATFLNFMGYALGASRLSALSRFGVVYVMTHDSIGLGEDGPTHQPVEMLEQLRAMPNMVVLRPADGNEVSGAYYLAMQRTTTPTVLCLSRQGVPNLEGSAPEKVAQGAYVLSEHGGNDGDAPALILASTGTEVGLCVQVAKAMAEESNTRVRVVSFPSQELFAEQTQEYRASVLPDGIPVMSVEASATRGWEKYSHASHGLDRFGMSAPGGAVYERLGFTVDNLKARANEVLQFYTENGPAPSLTNRIVWPDVEQRH